MCVCARVCVCVWVRACVSVRACVCVCVCVHMELLFSNIFIPYERGQSLPESVPLSRAPHLLSPSHSSLTTSPLRAARHRKSLGVRSHSRCVWMGKGGGDSEECGGGAWKVVGSLAPAHLGQYGLAPASHCRDARLSEPDLGPRQGLTLPGVPRKFSHPCHNDC